MVQQVEHEEIKRTSVIKEGQRLQEKFETRVKNGVVLPITEEVFKRC